ncbi:MAG TPA: phosphatase PAP2 family protein [Vicinamibacterales bacterium]|nr:phosphatase PAP2 family protein [Vicinamibacterales bacterium]
MLMALAPAELGSFLFFVYCAALAMAHERVRRRRVLAGAIAGLVCAAGWVASRPAPILHDWILPPVVLLIGYWTSGALFVAASPAAERALMAFDRLLSVRAWSARAPRFVAEFLEIAYVGVYPLIPIALAIHVTLTPDPDPDRFWAVILITDYVCFGVLPWVQTRPPRALEAGEPWRSSIRPFNMHLLGAASIGVNTFPSGHAAEALAAALLVLGAPLPVVAWMLFNAAAIGAAAVFGRYHYAADAISGYAVALLVWAAL